MRWLRQTFPRVKLRRQICMSRVKIWGLSLRKTFLPFRALLVVKNNTKALSPNSSECLTPRPVAELSTSHVSFWGLGGPRHDAICYNLQWGLNRVKDPYVQMARFSGWVRMPHAQAGGCFRHLTDLIGPCCGVINWSKFGVFLIWSKFLFF